MARPTDATSYGRSLAFLLSQVGAHAAALFAAELEPLGISPRQFAVLSHIASGQPRTQQQLSDLLGIHRNNMVGLIDEMESAGWVERHRKDGDRRAFEIRPTPTGVKLLARVNAAVPALNDSLAVGLTAAQRADLERLLQRTADGLGLAPALHPSVSTR